MHNNRGLTVTDRLEQDIEYAKKIKSVEHKEILAIKALGAVDLAVEFNLITYKEWGKYIDKIFEMM